MIDQRMTTISVRLTDDDLAKLDRLVELGRAQVAALYPALADSTNRSVAVRIAIAHDLDRLTRLDRALSCDR